MGNRGATPWALVALLATGCATAVTGPESDPADASVAPDAPRTTADGGCATGYTGPGCKQCSGGFHDCSGKCVQDTPNKPENGCTKGCGSACAPPANATAKCTSEGTCDFTCNAGFDKTGTTCGCPMGQKDCGGKCAQCCTGADCPSHVACTQGVCGGCEPGWGDCNQSMGDGCEVQLNSDGNCGSCGNSCCSLACGCGFLGLGGKSCKASGQSFSCQC
jgi:hypothetical protein